MRQSAGRQCRQALQAKVAVPDIHCLHFATGPNVMSQLAATNTATAAGPFVMPATAPSVRPQADAWMPPEPSSLTETGLAELDLEALILKLLLTAGTGVGRRIAEQIRLPFGLVAEVLRNLKAQLLVNYKNQATMGDYEYELTEDGRKKARWHAERCTYCGAAPVPLREYIASSNGSRSARPVRSWPTCAGLLPT